MRFGNKILISFFLIGGIPLIALAIIAYLFSSQVLIQTEVQNLSNSLSAVESFLDLEKAELQKTLEDYVLWSDHYQAILEKNYSWLDENITSWLPEQFRIDLLILWDRSGGILNTLGDPSSLEERTRELSFSKSIDQLGFLSGFESLGGELAIVSSGPILKNDGTGPPAGALLIAKKITIEELSLFESSESFPLIFVKKGIIVNPRFSDLPQLKELEGALSSPSFFQAPYITLSRGAIVTQKPILNSEGEEIARLGYFCLAEEVSRARRTTLAYSLVIGSGFFLLSLLASGLLQKWLLSPLNDLQRDAEALLSGKDIPQRKFSRDNVGAIASSLLELYEKSKKDREKAEAENAWFKGILDSSQDVIVVFDSNGKLVEANKAAEIFFSQSKNQFIGLTPKEALKKLGISPESLTSTFWDGFNGAINSGKPFEYEGYFEGLGKQVLVSFLPLLIEKDIKGVIITIKDVTSLRKLETERRTLLEGVAHDLGSPITTLLAAVELLKMGPELKEAKSYLRGMENNLLLLRNLVQNLLNLNRLEAGTVKTEPTKIELPSFMEKIRLMFLPLVQSRRLNFAVDCPSDLPPIKADPTHLEQVFSNILSNSLKYTPPDGLILISANKTDSMIKITFSDTGYGIPPEEIELVFKRFQQGRSGRRAGGSGLGLFITKSLVELMGGTISLKSEKGKGTTVEVSLPLYQDQES